MNVFLIFAVLIGVSTSQQVNGGFPTSPQLLSYPGNALNVKREIPTPTATSAFEPLMKKKKKKRKITNDDAPEKPSLEASPAANSLTDNVQAEKDKREVVSAFPNLPRPQVATPWLNPATNAEALPQALSKLPMDSTAVVDTAKRNVQISNPNTIPNLQDATVDKNGKKREESSPKGEELMEKIYEEEKDMKKMMARIVKEEKKMEKMLHKLEKLEKQAIAGMEKATGTRMHGHRRQYDY